MHLLITLLFAIATAHSSEFRSTNKVTWEITTKPTALTELSDKISGFVITGTPDATELTKVEDVEVQFTLDESETYSEITAFAKATAALKTEMLSNTGILFEADEDTNLEGLPLVGGENVYVWVVYTIDGASSPVQEKVAEPLAVTEATGAFTVEPTELAENLVDVITSIAIESTDIIGPIKVKIEVDSTESNAGSIVKDVETKSGDVYTVPITAGELSKELGEIAAGAKLLISVSTGAKEAYLLTKKEITITAAPDYLVDPAEVEWSKYKADLTFEVKPAAESGSNTAWKAFSIAISKNAFLSGDDVAEVKHEKVDLTDGACVFKFATADLTNLSLSSPATLWVYAVDDETIDPTAVTPVRFEVKPDPPAFTVSEIEVTAEKKIETLTITTPDPATGWHANAISAMLKWTTVEVKINLTVASPPGANAAITYTATDIDVSTWTTIATNDNIIVSAAKSASDNPEYLLATVTKQATVIDPVEPELLFDFLPETITYKDKSIVISAQPTTGTWDENIVKCIFTFENEEPKTEPAGLTFTLAKADPPGDNEEPTEYDWKATIDMSTITVPKDTAVIYAWIKLDDKAGANAAEVLEVPFQITYTSAPAATFTVAPTSVDLRTATKASIVVTETAESKTWVEDVYFFFSLTEVSAEPASDKLKKATKATDKWTYELTLADLAGIKKGDKIYVYVKHSVTKPGATWLQVPASITVDQTTEPEAAMGVSPLLSLLAAALLLLVKLF